MTDQADLLVQFSNALATRAEAAKNAVVAIRLAHGRHITGMAWRSEIVVASEQSLPRKDDLEIGAAGGAVLTAKVAGRDPGTNIAILRLAQSIASPSIAAGEARTGAGALAMRAGGTGGARGRVGGWRSEETEGVVRARGWGSSISPAPSGIAATAA